ncbi:MAG: hypothetical protein CMJ84_03830 [Planctomycetes bacterium]|nr:hypothetical protein [Planctomycetota bacterium]
MWGRRDPARRAVRRWQHRFRRRLWDGLQLGSRGECLGRVAGLSASLLELAARAPILLFAVLACAAPEVGHHAPPTLDAGSAARGERLFLGSCAGYCHAPAHGGRGDAPDLFDCSWLYGGTDEAVFRVLSEGVPGTDMQAFADQLPESDRWILVAWIRSQSVCEKAAGSRSVRKRVGDHVVAHQSSLITCVDMMASGRHHQELFASRSYAIADRPGVQAGGQIDRCHDLARLRVVGSELGH